jgi:hypothetical protein
VGEFVFGPNSDEVEGRLVVGVSPDTAEEAFRRTVLPLALQAVGYEVLHASAVLAPEGVVALCGISGTGKTTLAYTLTTLGYQAYADDALALEVVADDIAARLLPFRLMIRPLAASFFALEEDGTEVESALPSTAPLAGVCLLERDPAAEGAIVSRVSGGRAVTGVLRHAYSFTLDEPTRTRRMIDSYLLLVSRIPVVELRFRPDLGGLRRLAEEVAGVFAIGSPT